jgi:hypothetical protein
MMLWVYWYVGLISIVDTLHPLGVYVPQNVLKLDFLIERKREGDCMKEHHYRPAD